MQLRHQLLGLSSEKIPSSIRSVLAFPVNPVNFRYFEVKGTPNEEYQFNFIFFNKEPKDSVNKDVTFRAHVMRNLFLWRKVKLTLATAEANFPRKEVT